jgi:hypothetical protein
MSDVNRRGKSLNEGRRFQQGNTTRLLLTPSVNRTITRSRSSIDEVVAGKKEGWNVQDGYQRELLGEGTDGTDGRARKSFEGGWPGSRQVGSTKGG